ncbi:hypothetical protein AB8B25_39540, partial [Streptomyces sp. BF23-30]
MTRGPRLPVESPLRPPPPLRPCLLLALLRRGCGTPSIRGLCPRVRSRSVPGALTAGLDVPRDLDFGDRALALEQLKVHPATNSRMVSLVMDILPEREAGLLVGSRRWPLLAARMQNIRASDSTHTVAQHLNRLTVYSSWKQATGTALVGRLVDATLNALTTPLAARPAPPRRPLETRRRSGRGFGVGSGRWGV